MPFTALELRGYCGASPDPQKLDLVVQIANIYLAKMGDTPSNKSLIDDSLMMCLSCYIGNARDSLIRGVAEQFNGDLHMRMPDRVALLLSNPPAQALITTHSGISTAPTLPSVLSTRYVFDKDETGVLAQHGYEKVGYRATTSDFLPALSKGGFAHPDAVGNTGNGEQRGKGIYVGVGGSVDDVKRWAKLSGKPPGTKAVVLEIYARMGFMKGKYKPMDKFGSDGPQVKAAKFERWDAKYDYVTGDINAMRGAQEIKFTETGLKDLRMVVAWEGIPS